MAELKATPRNAAYARLLGPENWEKLQSQFPQELPPPRSHVEQKLDELYYGDTDDMEAPVQDMLNDYLHNLYNKE